MKPEVSVVVPVYNVERYLGECLDSILAQTFANIEVICIEDCSKDRSPGILESYASKDHRVRVVRHTRNSGLSAARNTGIDAAKGEWVLFVDSDDIVSRTLCERTLLAAREVDADVVFYGHAPFLDGTLPRLEPKMAKVMLPARTELLRRQAFAWTKLVRRDLLNRKNIRFPVGLCFEDVPVHWRLSIESEKPAFLDETHVGYRQRSGSITYRKDWSRADGLKVYDIVAEQLRLSGDWTQYSERFHVAESENFVSTYAYFELANPDMLSRVREEVIRRMTSRHRELASGGKAIAGWRRSILLSIFSEPRDVGPLCWASHRTFAFVRSLARRALHALKHQP